MTPGPTTVLAEHAAGIGYDDLPPEAVERARQVIADALACGIAGSIIAKEITGPLAAYRRSLDIPGSATVLLDGSRAAQQVASMVNAATIHTIDYDDTHLDAVAHLGAPVVATALAALETRGGGGRELIEAVVAGFEVAGRLGRAINPDHYQRFHATSTLGGIAAAAAAARAMGLDTERTEIAIGFAADDAGGTRYCIKQGDFSKSLHAGAAAWKGAQAALLAEAGAAGPTGFLEHEVGFLWAYTDERDHARLETEAAVPLGEHWEILKADIKAHPCILSAHTAIDGAQTLVQRHGLRLDDIRQMVLYQRGYSQKHGMNYHPDSVMAARLSVPFCVIVGIIDGKVGLEQFSEERFGDPEVLRHMPKVTVEADFALRERYPTSASTRVEITTASGDLLVEEVGYARGSHHRPMGPDEFAAKQRELLAYRLDGPAVERWLRLTSSLETLDGLEELADLLRTSPAEAAP